MKTSKIESADEFVMCFVAMRQRDGAKAKRVAPMRGEVKPRVTFEQMAYLYIAEGLTAREIAESYGTTVPTVRKWLAKFGIRRS